MKVKKKKKKLGGGGGNLGIFISDLGKTSDSLSKQFGPRSGPAIQLGLIRVQTDILMVFLKEFFEQVNFEKYQQTTKSMKNYPVCNELTTKGSWDSSILTKTLQENGKKLQT